MKHESKASLDFIPNNLGRIELWLYIQKANQADMMGVQFHLDTGSDFTTVDFAVLAEMGYTERFLQSCPVHKTQITTVAQGSHIELRYIEGVTVSLDGIELKNQKIFFSSGHSIRNLLGQDLLKYFNIEINRDFNSVTLTLTNTVAEQVESGMETDICCCTKA